MASIPTDSAILMSSYVSSALRGSTPMTRTSCRPAMASLVTPESRSVSANVRAKPSPGDDVPTNAPTPARARRSTRNCKPGSSSRCCASKGVMVQQYTLGTLDIRSGAEVVEAHRIACEDGDPLVLGDARHRCLDRRPRVGIVGVAVRIVARPHDAVDTDAVSVVDAVPVGDIGEIGVLPDVITRKILDVVPE